LEQHRKEERAKRERKKASDEHKVNIDDQEADAVPPKKKNLKL